MMANDVGVNNNEARDKGLEDRIKNTKNKTRANEILAALDTKKQKGAKATAEDDSPSQESIKNALEAARKQKEQQPEPEKTTRRRKKP